MEKIQLALQKARESRLEHDERSGERSGERAGERLGSARRAPVPAPVQDHSIEVGDLRTIRTAQFSAKALARYKTITTIGNHIAVEAFRVLRAQILNRIDTGGGQLIAVTSPHQGEGKTFVSLNLSIALARQLNRGAIIVDADIRRPAVNRYLAQPPEGQTSDVLLGERSLADCLLRTDLDDLLILPQREAVQRSSELLSSTRMHSLATALRQHFPDRLVIFDAPPLLATDDSLVLQRVVDSVLLVIQEGTTRADLRRAVELIDESRFLGCIMNNTKWHDLPTYYY